MSNKIKISDLKPGTGINHPTFGYLRYYGKARLHPFTTIEKDPAEYIFIWPVDERGYTRPDIVIKNGDQLVEIVE